MAAGRQETKLDLVIGAVDRFTAPLRALNERVANNTQGVRRLGSAMSQLNQEAGISKLTSRVKGLGRAVFGVGDGFAQVFGRLTRLGGLVSVALGAAGGGVTALVTESARAGQEVERLAGRAGVTSESFQRLAYAAALGGADADAFASVLQDLGEKAFDAATGSEDLQSTFRALGINIRTANGDVKKSDQLFAELADAFARMEDGPTKTAMALQLFSEEGARLIPILNQGSAGLARMGAEAESLGLVLDSKALTQSRDFARGMDQLRATLRGLGLTVGQTLIPVLLPLIERLRDWAMANRQVLASRVRDWVEGVAGRLPDMVKALEAAISGLGTFFAWLGRASDALGGADRLLGVVAAVLSGPLLVALAGAAKAVLALGAAVMTTPVGWIMAAIAAIAGAVYLIYKNWDGISAWFKAKWQAVTKIFADAWAAITDLVPDFGAIWGRIQQAFRDGVERLTGLLPDWLKDWMGIGDGKPVINVPEVRLPEHMMQPLDAAAAPVGIPAGAAGMADGGTRTEIQRRESTVRLIVPEGYRIEGEGADALVIADDDALGYMGA